MYQKILFIFVIGLSNFVDPCARFSKISFAQLYHLHAKAQVARLSEFEKEMHLNKSLSPDILTAYLLLFQKMKLSQMVPLFSTEKIQFAKNCVAYFINNIIVLTPLFNQLSLSQQVHTLLHEFRHAKQNEWLSNNRSIAHYHLIDAMFKYYIERDAENFATTMIQCPYCLYCCRAISYNPVNGYFGPSDYDPYIRKAKTLCPAHADCAIELENALLEKDKKKLIDLDNSTGTLIDRIPNVIVQKRFSLKH